MKNYSSWHIDTSNTHEEKVFDLCKKSQAIINNSTLEYECIINDANEWQNNVDAIILIKKSVYTGIKCGDVITVENKNYIVFFEPEDRDFFWSAKMRLSNNTLKFYDKNGNSSQFLSPDGYHEIPCIFSKGSIDLQEGRFMSLPSGNYRVIIPSGVITKSEEDLNKRYILNDAPYDTVGIDNSKNGLVEIEIKDGNFVDDDNRTLGIANYWSNQSNNTIPPDEIKIMPTTTNIGMGKSVTYTASFYDDGVENNSVTFNWVISNVDGTNNVYATITPMNKTCIISVSNSTISVGKFINIRISLVENATRYIDKQFKIISLV